MAYTLYILLGIEKNIRGRLLESVNFVFDKNQLLRDFYR